METTAASVASLDATGLISMQGKRQAGLLQAAWLSCHVGPR